MCNKKAIQSIRLDGFSYGSCYKTNKFGGANKMGNEEQYCIDMFTTTYCKWMDDYNIKTKTGLNGQYLSMVVTNNEKKKVIKKISKSKIKYRCYEKRWERSSDYRKEFFEYYQPPYKCRYCNKLLNKNYMVIDHIVPIAQVKKSTNARMKLYMRGISEVNDVRNLAPSCKKCNDRKGMKLGVWYWKGILGQYKWYWITRKIIFNLMILLIICFVLKYLPLQNPLF